MLGSVYCSVISFSVWHGVVWVELVIAAWSRTGCQPSGMVMPLVSVDQFKIGEANLQSNASDQKVETGMAW